MSSLSGEDVFTATMKSVATLLRDSGKLGSIEVLCDHQQNLETKIEEIAVKATGNLILISDVGGQNNDTQTTNLKLSHVFAVTLWSPAYIKPDATPANAIKQTICQILSGHRPIKNGAEVHFNERWIVSGCVRVDSPDLLVHRIPVQIPIQLPKL